MFDNNKDDLKDYKFFCFNGRPDILLVCSERFSSSNMCETWYDKNLKLLPIIENNHRIDKEQKLPSNIENIANLSKKLSKNIPFVRVDFYAVKDKIYFGELTFFPASGYEKFNPEEYDEKLGNFIDLNVVKKNEK